MKRYKNSHLYFTLISLVILVVLQTFCTTAKSTFDSEPFSPELQQEMEEVASFIDPLNTQELSTSKLNEYCQILVSDNNGKILYWNTTELSLPDFSPDDQYTYSVKKGTNSIHYKVDRIGYNTSTDEPSGTLVVETNIQETAPSNNNSLIEWLSVVAYLMALYSFFLFAYKKAKEQVFTTPISISISLLVCIVFIVAEQWLQLPDFFDTDFSIGLGMSTDVLQVLSLMSWTTICVSLINRQSTSSDLPVWFVSFATSFSIGVTIVMIIACIRGVINSDILESSLDRPIQYSTLGIAFITLLVFLCLMIFYISTRAHGLIEHRQTTNGRYIGMGLGTLITGLLTYLLDLQVPSFAIMAFLLAYLLILDIYVDQQRKTAVFAFLWMIIFSGFMASIIFYFQLSRDITERKIYAESLYTPLDTNDLTYMLAADEMIRNSVISSQLASLPYPAKLDKSDFTSFLLDQLDTRSSSYSINVECFEAGGSTIFRDHFAQSTVVKNTLTNADRKSQYIYYDPLSAKYLLSYYIENEGYNASPLHLVIQLKSKAAHKLIQYEGYQFTVLKDEKVIAGSQSEILEFPLESIAKDNTHEVVNDKSFVVHKPTDRITVLVSRRLDGLLKPISLFSFILTIAGLFLLVIGIINSRSRFLPDEVNILFDYQSSLRNKIQFTIILLTIFSFVLIGLMTIIYFKNVLELRSNETKESQITSILNNIQSLVSYSDEQASRLRVLSGKLSEVSHIHQKDLNLFDLSGSLVATSLLDVKDIRLEYSIFRELEYEDYGHVHTYQTNESLTHYIPLLDSRGQSYGTLGVIDKNASYSSNLLDFLSTILNVYIFLFLVAGAIAVAISNSITKPLSSLSEKLKLFRLGKNQEPIKWSSKDEIGALISNFNDLAAQLEESADIIAKTERDTAWREMAKQVAHEIKNPLTPMKLSIQHLQRVVKSDADDTNGMIDRVSKTLLEQFNNLDNIANSFSNFASMPQADNAKIMLNEVVEAVHDLFRKREDITITLTEPINDLYIYADRNQVVRVLNNIVKNAIQAIPHDQHGLIEISLNQVNDYARIKVSDDGVGIPDEMKKKVFTPNFTTKNSGTGLGLAISANMIESFNGRIYFETELGKGTDFFIEIPLMKLDQNFSDNNRVSL